MSLLERLSSRTPDDLPPSQAAAVAIPKRARGAALRPDLLQAKAKIHMQPVELSAAGDLGHREQVQARITALTETFVRSSGLAITQTDFDSLVDSLVDDVSASGRSRRCWRTPRSPRSWSTTRASVYVERGGRLQLSRRRLRRRRATSAIIERIVARVGRRVDRVSRWSTPGWPTAPASTRSSRRWRSTGRLLTIRKFAGALTARRAGRVRSARRRTMPRFLEACGARQAEHPRCRGAPAAGKTTLLNVLSAFIPPSERIITIEDAAELQLQQTHVVALETRPPNVEGKRRGHASASCCATRLRMRPDRIIVGECRGDEALDMLQAMNTGHDGSMTTVHANTRATRSRRLETHGPDGRRRSARRAIHKQITAVDMIVQAQRLRGGARRIVSITELTGFHDGEVAHQELFSYRQLGVSGEGAAYGYHSATGHVPTHLEHLRQSGEDLSPTLFKPTPQPLREDLY